VTDSIADSSPTEPDGWDAELSVEHLEALLSGGVTLSTVYERGYVTLLRGDRGHEALLRDERFTVACAESLRRSPGLLIPVYNPVGERVSAHYRPDEPLVGNDGKSRKYLMPFSTGTVLDVHPANTEDVRDTSVPLYVTEGVKKGDALTSRGLCAVSLAGVWNWKRDGAAHPDWESIPVKGRRVVLVFDADATSNDGVTKAQRAFAVWMRDTKRADVRVAILPGVVGDQECKGVDDHFVAGWTLDDLEACLTTDVPEPESTRPAVAVAAEESVRDDMIVAEVADNLMVGRYRYSPGLGWVEWDEPRWTHRANESQILNEIKDHLRAWFDDRASELVTSGQVRGKAGMDAMNTLRRVCAKGKWDMTLAMCSGYPGVATDDEQFDADPDVINTPSGIVSLRTGMQTPGDPDRLMTKLTGCAYVAGATHPDWDAALDALPDDATREWWQLRMGQALTGYVPPDDVMLFVQGHGSNGKSTVLDGVTAAFGDYFTLVSRKLLVGSQSDHPTESMTLFGARLAAIEELPEGRHLNLALLKSHVGTSKITARKMRRDNVTFFATHALMVNTNYAPQVEETDHGTWRRLCMVRFPFTYRKPGEVCDGAYDRVGDGDIRQRIKMDPRVHEAVLAWLVQGAMRWYAAGRVMPPPPTTVDNATRDWRRTSDVLMGYLDERMVVDKDAHVSSTEMLRDVNTYLELRSHRPWSEKLLASRIDGHGLTRHVERRQVRGSTPGTGKLSRPHGANDRMPERYTAYLGLRFRSPGDEDAPGPFDDRDPFTPQPAAPQVDPVDTPPVDGPVLPDCTDTTEGDTVFTSSEMEELSNAFHEPPRVVTFDVESPSVDRLMDWDVASEGPWARLCGYSVDGGKPVTTTDVEELLRVLHAADVIVAHNGLNYDLIGLARHHGADYERLSAKCDDLLVVARQLDPPSAKKGNDRTHYDLDSIGMRMVGAGKHGDLEALKNRFKGYHLIPTDNVEYRRYLVQDVQLLNDLRPLLPTSRYINDERDFLAACGGMTLRGVAVDIPLVTERAAAEEQQKRDALRELHESAGLPLEKVTEKVKITRKGKGTVVGRVAEREAVLSGATSFVCGTTVIHGEGCPRLDRVTEGGACACPTEDVVREIDPDDYEIKRTEERETYASPLAAASGIAWLEGVWNTYLRDGVNSPVVPRTEKGRLCTKRDALQEVIDGTATRPPCPPALASVLDLMNTANGARVVYATVLKNMIDGRYHPRMSSEQASGRVSCGVTVFGKHGGKVRERAVFVADEGELMVAFDYDQVDARAVAAHCQDPRYMDLFDGHADFHTANAVAIFGDAKYREVAKKAGHGENYGMGINGLVKLILGATDMTNTQAREYANAYVDAMEQLYPVRNKWRAAVRERADRGELLDNGFGRMMRPEVGRGWTQGPALLGQGTTRDIMRKSILDLHPDVRRCLKFTVHDELVFSFPEHLVDEYSNDVMRAMTFDWFPAFLPSDSRPVHITCGRSKAAPSWAGCYA
jgi:P4 family phage/plasmid primase-like protien